MPSRTAEAREAAAREAGDEVDVDFVAGSEGLAVAGTRRQARKQGTREAQAGDDGGRDVEVEKRRRISKKRRDDASDELPKT